MKLLERRQSSRTFGDETALYDVKLNRPCSVTEFIVAVLDEYPKEWGEIEIKSVNGEILAEAEYRRGEIVSEKVYKDTVIYDMVAGVSAHGGWSKMDYIIKVKNK